MMSKNPLLHKQVIGIPSSAMGLENQTPKSKMYLPDASTAAGRLCVSSSSSLKSKQKYNEDSMMIKRKEPRRTFTNGDTKNGKLARKISEAVKRKLRLGTRILQEGGVERIFKRCFRVDSSEEKLLKTCQCYLSTTAGPISGLLFISTQRVAFCSERSINIYSPNGESLKVHYKVSIPLSKMKRLNQSVNPKKASQKYIDIVTVDDFDFWFMGFLNHRKAFKCLQQAFSQTLLVVQQE